MRGKTKDLLTCLVCGGRRVRFEHYFHDGLLTCRACSNREAARTAGRHWTVHDIPATEAFALYAWLRYFASQDPRFGLLAAAELRRIVKTEAGWIGRWRAVYDDSELVARRPRGRGKEVRYWLGAGASTWEKPELRKISPPGELELDGLLAMLKAAPKFEGRSRFVTYGVGTAKKAMLKQALRYRKKGMRSAPDPEALTAPKAQVDRALRFLSGHTTYSYASNGNLEPLTRSLNAAEKAHTARAVADANKCARTVREAEQMNIEEKDKPAPDQIPWVRLEDAIARLGRRAGSAWTDAIQDADALEAFDKEDRLAEVPGRTDERAEEMLTLWEACLGVHWRRSGEQASALSEYTEHVTLSPDRRCEHPAIKAPGAPSDAVRRAANRARHKMTEYLREQRQRERVILPEWAERTGAGRKRANPEGARLFQGLAVLLSDPSRLSDIPPSSVFQPEMPGCLSWHLRLEGAPEREWPCDDGCEWARTCLGWRLLPRDLANFFLEDGRTDGPEQYLVPRLKAAEIRALVGVHLGGSVSEMAGQMGLATQRLQTLWVSDRQRDSRRRA
jgi:hypothetical protein